jgi:hypothetical protein
MIFLSRLVGIVVLLFIVAFDSVVVLLIMDFTFLACVLGNSITLVSVVSSYDKRKPNVT